MVTPSRLDEALSVALRRLLEARNAAGHWTGTLSTSALSTATACFALTLVSRRLAEENDSDPRDCVERVTRGLDWLVHHANPDGGWGDTTRSLSNISTTTLCWAALNAAPHSADSYRPTIERAESWLRERTGSLEPRALSRAIVEVYGEDRTFSVPILTMCALAGRLGEGREAWRHVISLPYELAALPRGWFKHLGLSVVSYALPALIAVGQAKHHHQPSLNPLCRLVRILTRSRSLNVLERIQPANGGFLEATPLTSFVAMSLAGSGRVRHPVTEKCVQFLLRSQRSAGNWPIDTNLATWVTTLSVNALAGAGLLQESTDDAERQQILDWLLDQQYLEPHEYTGAAPGAWAWTDLPGGVPDADDTSGALLALRNLSPTTSRTSAAAARGLRWLMDLQNRDGGIPTFCRGWGKLPFDRSGADLTAHALRALLAWRGETFPGARAPSQREVDAATERAVEFLRSSQEEDGSWTPLWFGNQLAPRSENRTYGTARVLIALRDLEGHDEVDVAGPRDRAVTWLLRAQNVDGGWGGSGSVASSVEETAVALDALTGPRPEIPPGRAAALGRGTDWLVSAVEAGRLDVPTPIGFYFARLWYHEELYPTIFTTAALGRVKKLMKRSPDLLPGSSP